MSQILSGTYYTKNGILFKIQNPNVTGHSVLLFAKSGNLQVPAHFPHLWRCSGGTDLNHKPGRKGGKGHFCHSFYNQDCCSGKLDQPKELEVLLCFKSALCLFTKSKTI